MQQALLIRCSALNLPLGTMAGRPAKAGRPVVLEGYLTMIAMAMPNAKTVAAAKLQSVMRASRCILLQ
jgi:hypothetical protein